MVDSIVIDFLNKINFKNNKAKEIIEKIFSFLSEEELFFTLNPSVSSIFSPFLFKDMTKSCKKIISTLENNENILIFGDKDVDGMIGTFLLKDFLDKYKLNFSSSSEIFFELPQGDENYGISPEVIEKYSKSVSLIITVDNGISAKEALRKSKELNVDVIITDHHELYSDEILELSYAVINPKVDKVGNYLSGSGVALFLILGLLIYYFYTEINLYTVLLNNTNEIQFVEISNFVPKVKNFKKDEFLRFITSEKRFITLEKKKNFIFLNQNHINSVIKQLPKITNIIDKFFLINDIIETFNIEDSFEKLITKFDIPAFLGTPQKISKALLLIHVFGKNEIKSFIDKYSPLVGLTVLSDNMPFLSYNKFFIQEATKRLTKTNIDSIRFLVNSKITKNDNIKVRDLTMSIIPFINSSGRMGKGKKVIELLLENDVKKIELLLEELKEIDNLRKSIVHSLLEKFYEKAKNDRVVVSESIEKGLISLLSTKIAMEVDYPIVIMSNGGSGEVFSGSARFRNGDVFSIMKSLSHYFENFGGHKRAAGFIISKNKIEDFVKDFLNTDYRKFTEEYTPLMKIEISKIKEFAKLLYSIEPLNDDLRPTFEDEITIEDYKKNGNLEQYLIKTNGEWIITNCSYKSISNLIGEKVKIIYSYEFKFNNKLQEEVFIPKILEIRNG